MTGATELRRATGSNTVPIPLAAGVAAWAGILLNPTRCALLMNMSTVILAFNAMLLSRRTTGLTSASGGRPCTITAVCGRSANQSPALVHLAGVGRGGVWWRHHGCHPDHCRGLRARPLRPQPRGSPGTRLRVLLRVGRVPARSRCQHRSDGGSAAGGIQSCPGSARGRRIVPHRAPRGVRDRGARARRSNAATSRGTARCSGTGFARDAGRLAGNGWGPGVLGKSTGHVDNERRAAGAVRVLTRADR